MMLKLRILDRMDTKYKEGEPMNRESSELKFSILIQKNNYETIEEF